MKNIIIRKYIEFAVKENQSIADLIDFLAGTSVDALAEYCVENNIIPAPDISICKETAKEIRDRVIDFRQEVAVLAHRTFGAKYDI
jgi:hypothetical protein